MFVNLKDNRGAVALATILLGFTLGGLICGAAGAREHYLEKENMTEVVTMIREAAETMKASHGDDPYAIAQAAAWESMAREIEINKDFVYERQMLQESINLAVGLIPGRLPIAKASQELVEAGLNLYNTYIAVGSILAEEPAEPSEEMKAFIKSLSQDKAFSDALEMAILNARKQALIRSIDNLKSDLAEDKAFQEKQQELRQNYHDLFIQHALRDLEEDSQLSSTTKRWLMKGDWEEDLRKYPQLREALKNKQTKPTTEDEKMEIDGIFTQIVKEDKSLTEVLAENMENKQADWEKDIGQMVVQLGKIVQGEVDTSQVNNLPAGEIEAKGRIIAPAGFWQMSKSREYENNLQLKFNSSGGQVTGSFNWSYGHRLEGAAFKEVHRGSLTGKYTKGGGLQGQLTGSITNTVAGRVNNEYSGSMIGSWTAQINEEGKISGQLKYTNPLGEQKQLSFQATGE